MQSIENKTKIGEINKDIKFLNQFQNLNFKNRKFSDENKIFNQILPESNMQVIRPIPIKNFKDTNFLSKKRSRSKGLFPYNNYFKNSNENSQFLPFQSNYNIFGKPKMQINPYFNSDFYYINNNILNLKQIDNQENKKKKKLSQIKINLIINNYISIENPLIKEKQEEKNNKIKKKIFGITTNKSKLKKKNNSIVANTTESINSNKNSNENKENTSQIINSKKFEIFKTNNLDENDNLSYDEIRKLPKNKKRGRKALKEGKRQHNALDQDNIIRKIQVHFLSFIIYFCNDLIQAFLPTYKDLCFKNIQYELKKTVNHAYIENLKSKNIGDILQLTASPKNKKCNGNINQITYNKICIINPFLKEFFKMPYLDMFNNYYCQNLREIEIEGCKVKLSQRTRLFIDLISKNISSAEKIKEIAEEYFINKKKGLNPIFVINKK